MTRGPWSRSADAGRALFLLADSSPILGTNIFGMIVDLPHLAWVGREMFAENPRAAHDFNEVCQIVRDPFIWNFCGTFRKVTKVVKALRLWSGSCSCPQHQTPVDRRSWIVRIKADDYILLGIEFRLWSMMCWSCSMVQHQTVYADTSQCTTISLRWFLGWLLIPKLDLPAAATALFFL